LPYVTLTNRTNLLAICKPNHSICQDLRRNLGKPSFKKAVVGEKAGKFMLDPWGSTLDRLLIMRLHLMIMVGS
jgi:hypothetical protein